MLYVVCVLIWLLIPLVENVNVRSSEFPPSVAVTTQLVGWALACTWPSRLEIAVSVDPERVIGFVVGSGKPSLSLSAP